ncbi:hypothetical protein MNV49_004740 [Pseudohyphozyma bogoriensis]|nr:hypothetical protein MNV49_004740 [Pseudohyphozyma bogoriensis]
MFASLLSSLASTGLTIAASFLPIPSTFSSSDADLDAHLARRTSPSSSSRTRATRTVADNFFAPPPSSSSSTTSRSPLSSTSSHPFAQPSPASIETLAALKAWAADNLVDLEHSEHEEPLDDDDASLASYDITTDDDHELTSENDEGCHSADDEERDDERFELPERPESPMARNLLHLDEDDEDDEYFLLPPVFPPSFSSTSSTPSLSSDSSSSSSTSDCDSDSDSENDDSDDSRFVHLPSLRRTFTRNSKAEYAIDYPTDYQKKAVFMSALRQGLVVIEA